MPGEPASSPAGHPSKDLHGFLEGEARRTKGEHHMSHQPAEGPFETLPEPLASLVGRGRGVPRLVPVLAVAAGLVPLLTHAAHL